MRDGGRLLASYPPQRQRKDVLRNLVLANQLLDPEDMPDTHSLKRTEGRPLRNQELEREKQRIWARIYQAAQDGISKLGSDKDKLVGSMNSLVEYMQKKGSSEVTISGHQLKPGKLYRWWTC